MSHERTREYNYITVSFEGLTFRSRGKPSRHLSDLLLFIQDVLTCPAFAYSYVHVRVSPEAALLLGDQGSGGHTLLPTPIVLSAPPPPHRV